MDFSKDSIRKELVNIYAKITGYTKQAISSGVYDVILNLFSYIIEKWAYYAEFLFREANWREAMLRESLIQQSYLLNYVPHRRKGASNKILVSPFPLDQESNLYNNGDLFIQLWAPVSNTAGTIKAYAAESKIIYNNTRIVKKSPDDGSIAVNLGTNNLIRIQVTNHEIPFNAPLKIIGSKFYDGEYINLNNSTNPSVRNNFIYIQAPFSNETFNSGDVSIYSGQAFLTIKQGTPKEYTYIASGIPNEQIILFSDKIENDLFEVYRVDNQGNILAKLEIVDELYLLNNTSIEACSVVNNDSYTQVIVQFGDGVRSRQTIAGEIYLIKYAETDGEAGNITSSGVINTIDTAFVLNAQGNDVTLYVNNLDPIIGGSEVENIESIRINGKELPNRITLLSKNDSWEAAINKYPSVLKSKVWTDADLEIFSNNTNIIHITGINKLGKPLSEADKTSIALNLINPNKSVSDIIRWEPLAIVHTFFDIKATIKKIPSSQAAGEITNALIEQYSVFSKFNNFATSIRESNFASFIQNAGKNKNVIFHTTELSHYERSDYISDIDKSIAGYTIQVSQTSLDNPDPEKQVYILENSVGIYLKRKINGIWYPDFQIATSNDALLVGVNGYTVSSGIINYATNQLDFNLNDLINGPIIPNSGGFFPDEGNPFSEFGVQNPTDSDPSGYIIKIRYKTKDGNNQNTNDIRLPYFYNIADCLAEDMKFTFSYD